MLFEQNIRHALFVFLWLSSLLDLTRCQTQEQQAVNIEIKPASEIQWQALNPARGDASPQAGTIWGNQTEDVASGFLVKFIDGFSSPPHIHNVTYRGIVLGGALHNDDPEAAEMWMPAGSWWTQPAGEVHITSARGSSVGYVEIQSGPYLVKPSKEAFDNGERPINMHTKNIIWLGPSDSSWIQASEDGANNAQITFLWGDPSDDQIIGSMLRFPKGFKGKLISSNTTFKVVVVKGAIDLHDDNAGSSTSLGFGSYFGSKGKATQVVSCEDECTVYVRSAGRYSVVPNKEPRQKE